MIWVGGFKSLQSALRKPRFGAPLEVHTWLRSEIGLISPFVDWLMSLIAGSRWRDDEPRYEDVLRSGLDVLSLQGRTFATNALDLFPS
jgi:hypothetical protein